MPKFTDDANAEAARRFMARHSEELPFNPLHRIEVSNGIRLMVFWEELSKDGNSHFVAESVSLWIGTTRRLPKRSRARQSAYGNSKFF